MTSLAIKKWTLFDLNDAHTYYAIVSIDLRYTLVTSISLIFIQIVADLLKKIFIITKNNSVQLFSVHVILLIESLVIIVGRIIIIIYRVYQLQVMVNISLISTIIYYYLLFSLTHTPILLFCNFSFAFYVFLTFFSDSFSFT